VNHPPKQQQQRTRSRGPQGGGGGGGGGKPMRSHNLSGGGSSSSSSGGGGGGRNQVFDSNGPEGRIRGNAHQVMERYLAMARDASSQGDRVAAENYYQHAEHYFRLLNAFNQNNGQRRPQNSPTPAEDQAEMSGEGDEENQNNESESGGNDGQQQQDSMGA
jgi:Domain of unknown function (DUF4167)